MFCHVKQAINSFNLLFLHMLDQPMHIVNIVKKADLNLKV